MAEWTYDDRWAARWDGWELVSALDSERPVRIAYTVKFRRKTGYSFYSDDAARMHVRDMALAGSPLARRALDYLREHSFGEYIVVMGSDEE